MAKRITPIVKSYLNMNKRTLNECKNTQTDIEEKSAEPFSNQLYIQNNIYL